MSYRVMHANMKKSPKKIIIFKSSLEVGYMIPIQIRVVFHTNYTYCITLFENIFRFCVNCMHCGLRCAKIDCILLYNHITYDIVYMK